MSPNSWFLTLSNQPTSNPKWVLIHDSLPWGRNWPTSYPKWVLINDSWSWEINSYLIPNESHFMILDLESQFNIFCSPYRRLWGPSPLVNYTSSIFCVWYTHGRSNSPTRSAYLVMHGMQESVGQEVEKAREEHGLDVRNQLSLPHQAVQAGWLLKALNDIKIIFEIHQFDYKSTGWPSSLSITSRWHWFEVAF